MEIIVIFLSALSLIIKYLFTHFYHMLMGKQKKKEEIFTATQLTNEILKDPVIIWKESALAKYIIEIGGWIE